MKNLRFWVIALALVFSIGAAGLGVGAAVHFLSKQRTRDTSRSSHDNSADTSPGRELDAKALAKQAHDILQANCHSCHGQDGAMEGGFNYAADSQRLVERRKVVPGQPNQSNLLRRIVDGEMPPAGEKQRPSTEEVAILRQWIERGAPALDAATSERSTITTGDIRRSMREDLAARQERDRPFVRYFTITHLYNSGLNEDELQTYRQALSKLVNSLSWGRDIVVPQPIDAAKTIFRIDLRDYKWDRDTWERLLADYPYGTVSEQEGVRELTESTGCRLPYVRGDWFTATASKPPLYYDLLQMPTTDHDLETLLRVDTARDIRAERVVRAGFNNSGVSRNNRIIERFESSYGALLEELRFRCGNWDEEHLRQPARADGRGPGLPTGRR